MQKRKRCNMESFCRLLQRTGIIIPPVGKTVVSKLINDRLITGCDNYIWPRRLNSLKGTYMASKYRKGPIEISRKCLRERKKRASRVITFIISLQGESAVLFGKLHAGTNERTVSPLWIFPRFASCFIHVDFI